MRRRSDLYRPYFQGSSASKRDGPLIKLASRLRSSDSALARLEAASELRRLGDGILELCNDSPLARLEAAADLRRLEDGTLEMPLPVTNLTVLEAAADLRRLEGGILDLPLPATNLTVL